MQPRILIADDQADILSALKLLLKREGLDVATATSPAGVQDVAAREHIDVALIDLNYTRDTTSGEEGLELVDHLRKHHPELPVVVMTAWATVEVAVQAMRRGANDFVEKP
ncbi:MAG: response regulator [Pseudomonadota bacterium]|nr:response regulator [Pseudomonadota bacterium]